MDLWSIMPLKPLLKLLLLLITAKHRITSLLQNDVNYKIHLLTPETLIPLSNWKHAVIFTLITILELLLYSITILNYYGIAILTLVFQLLH